MDHLNFEGLLKQEMGLDPASVGADTVERAVNARMQSCGVFRKEDYWDRLQSSRDELQQLIEAVVVPETWFFRDQEAFDALGRVVAEEWLPNHPVDILRLLSVPCCTGEEPYSMVMALLDSGLSRERLRVDAVDISVRALAFAAKAIYGVNSFRGQNLTYRNRYFEQTPRGYALSPLVREGVKFHHGNLLAPAFQLGSSLYDVIFCRNLLIYFDRPTQERVLGSLARALASQGILFVGSAEAFLATCNGFQSANRSLAFAFRKRTSRLPEAQEPRPTQTPTRQIKPLPKQAVAPPTTVKVTPLQPVPAAAQTPRDLAVARCLADAGRLREAAAACEAHLRQEGGSSSQAYGRASMNFGRKYREGLRRAS